MDDDDDDGDDEYQVTQNKMLLVVRVLKSGRSKTQTGSTHSLSCILQVSSATAAAAGAMDEQFLIPIRRRRKKYTRTHTTHTHTKTIPLDAESAAVPAHKRCSLPSRFSSLNGEHQEGRKKEMEKNTARGERERGIEKEREGEREREKGAARLVLSVGTQRYCSFSCRILERRRAIPQKGGRHHTLPQHVRTQRYLTVSCVDFLLNGIPMFDKKFVFSLIYSVPNRSLYRPPLTYLEPAAPPH